MTLKEILSVIVVILLIPIGAYLREQIYRSLHGNATIGRDIESLIQSFKEWRYRRELKKKYKNLNKRK